MFTPINHKVFFGGIPVVLESRRSSQGRGAHPQYPPLDPPRLGLEFTVPIGHFTVMDESEAEGDVVLIQTFLTHYVNQVILMLNSIFQEKFP